jgi:hypothetical protein
MQRLQYVNAADNDLDAIPSEASAAATCDIATDAARDIITPPDCGIITLQHATL